jgi:uncharacterized membrane protein
MKVKQLLVHPLLLMLSFSLIVINGMSYGNFYSWYVIHGLRSFEAHSIAGIAGILLLVFNMLMRRMFKNLYFYHLLNIFGSLLLYASLFLFFYKDELRANYDTFNHLLPLITLIVFVLLSVNFLIYEVREFSRYTSEEDN